MHDEIYLETDEEVTSAIEKIKKSKKKNVVLSLPRNAVLGQSIVNLKLIYKEAIAQGKNLVLASPDKITRSLAQRVGFGVAETAKAANFSNVKDKNEGEADTSIHEEEAESKQRELTKQRFDAGNEDEGSDDNNDEVADSNPPGFKVQTFNKAGEPNEVTAASEDASPEDFDDDQEDKPEKPSSASSPLPRNIESSASGGMIPTRGNLRFFRQQKRRAAFVPFLIGLGLIIVGLFTAGLLLPTANVKVIIKAKPFNETVNSNVDIDATAIDVAKAVIPGKLVSVDKESKSSAKATGKKDQGTKATGTVTLSNEWDSLPHTLAAGTTLKAQNGNQYITTVEATIPGATSTLVNGKVVITPGKQSVAIEAAAPGDGYNSSPTSFTIPSLPSAQQDKIYGTSNSAFTGGSSKIVTVVTQDDIDKLTTNVKKQNVDEAIVDIKAQATDKVYLDKAVQTVSQDVSSSAGVDVVADSSEVTVKGKFQVIAFAKKDQDELIRKLLEGKIPQGQTLASSGDGVSVDNSQSDLNLVTDKQLQITTNVKAFTVDAFNQNELRRLLQGKAPKSAKDILGQKVPIDTVEVTMKPAWWPRLPYLASKINVMFGYTAKEK